MFTTAFHIGYVNSITVRPIMMTITFSRAIADVEVKPGKEHAGATLEIPSEEILKKAM